MKDSRIIDFRYAPAHAQVCIGLVDDVHKTIVRDDGSINWGFDGRNALNYYRSYNEKQHAVQTLDEVNRGFSYRVRPTILHRDRLLSLRQDFGKASAAIVETIEDWEACTFSWKAFAWKTEAGARVDVILYRLTLKDSFKTTRSGAALQSLGQALPEGKVLYAPRQKTVSFSDEELPFLHAGEMLEGAWFILQDGAMEENEATLENAKRALSWSESYWERICPFEKTFSIPEPQIADMLSACGRNILQAREIKNGVYTYQVGPTEYRGLWMVDGHFLLESAHYMGRTQEAFAGVDAVLRYVKPNGAIVIMEHHDKETGIALATLCRQCELTNNDARLAELWPVMQGALGYIRMRRKESLELGTDYPGYGLYPPTFGDGGINGPEPEYTSVVWVLFGLRAAYLAGKRLKLPGYEEFLVEFEDMMVHTRKAIARDHRFTPEGIRYFPQSMLTEEAIQRRTHEQGELVLNKMGYKPQTGTWALAQSIYPGEVFADDDPVTLELLQLLDSVDNTEGIPENTGWETHNALWGYSAMFYGEAFLYANRPEKAVDYLYAFANHACPGRVWREEQGLRDSQSEEMCGDMPHNWGAAEFIRLVRHLLVMEKKENLELLKGLPEEWLPTDQMPLELEKTPTRYGEISIRMVPDGHGAYDFSFERTVFCQTPGGLLLHWPGRMETEAETAEGILTLPGDTLKFKAKLYR